MATYKVIDSETSIKNRGEDAVGKMKASPHCPLNGIVYYAEKDKGGETEAHKCLYTDPLIPDTDTILVGQNIKFDLLYLYNSTEGTDWREWVSAGGQVWDTQLAEYILTGQDHQWASLDQLAAKYGGTIKDDRLKELWANDVDTEDIDASIIVPYVINDVENTEKVFIAQCIEANKRGLMPLLSTQMDALLATCEMEYNGMYFDKVECLKEAQGIEILCDVVKTRAETFIQDRIPVMNMQPNAGSLDQISLALFGGQYKYAGAEPMMKDGEVVKFKTGTSKGEVRYKKVDKFLDIPQTVLPAEEWKAKKDGMYFVNDEVLNKLLGAKLKPVVDQFIKDILEYRKLKKDLSTYYIGYSNLTWPHDSCIHGNLNHCATKTGRLSHTAPNVGNVAHKTED